MRDEPLMNVVVRRMAEGGQARQLRHFRLDAGEMFRGCDDESETDGLLVVQTGCLRAFVSRNGKELTLFVLGPGEALRIRPDSQLEARRDSEVVFVPMKALRAFAASDPDLVLWAMPMFDSLLERSLRLVENIAFNDVEHRVIHALCDTAEREGRRSEGGIVLAPPPRAEDFAAEVGATRQSVSTVMAELVRSGILRRFGQHSVVISDIGRLRSRLSPAAAE